MTDRTQGDCLPRRGEVARSICRPLFNAFCLVVAVSWIDRAATALLDRDQPFIREVVGSGTPAMILVLVLYAGTTVMILSGLAWWQAATSPRKDR